MTAFDPIKAQEMSQSISAIYDHSEATLGEICAATTLALKVALEAEPDPILRGYLCAHILKNLMKEKNTPVFDLIKPNGN